MANELQARPDPDRRSIRHTEAPIAASYSGYAGRQSAGFDGSRLAKFIRDNYLLFLAIVIVTIGAAVVLTLNQTPTYITKATVMLDQRKQQVVQGLDEVVSGLPSADSSVVDTEVQLLSSSGLAYQVARAMKLVPDAEPETLSPGQQQDISETVRKVLDRREVQRVGLTYAIDIYYTSDNPQTAQAMANAFAQKYIESQINVRVQANARAREHLEREIAKLQDQVKEADAAIAQYKAANGLTGTAAGGTLTEQEISSYNQALTVARAQAAEDMQRLAAARSQFGRGTDSLGDSTSPGLAQLRNQEAAISARVAELDSRYGANHPDLITARQQLEDVRQLIRGQSGRAIASLQSQAQASAGRAAEIASRLSSTEGALKTASAASVRLHELQVKLDAPAKLLEAYQARLAQISTQAGTEQSDARIISLAPLPAAPSSPNWFVSMVLGIGGGILFGIAAVIVRQIFATGVRSAEEVEHMFGVDFLAALPSLRNTEDLAIIDKVVDEPASPFAEALRGLAASIRIGSATGPRIVALSSAFAEEGKSTTSIALGRVVAQRGRRVLIVDCDMQRPSFYHRFGIGGELGLVDVLQSGGPLTQAIVVDTRSPAHFLPLGRKIEPGQTLDEHALRDLLGHLRDEYDLILLDLPPVLHVAEARVIAALADTTILLARWKRTSKQAIDAALALLMRANVSVTGVALTQVPAGSEMMLGGYAPLRPRIEGSSD